MRSLGLAPSARTPRVSIMFEFLKQPISLKRAPKVADAPTNAADAPTNVADAPTNVADAPTNAADAPTHAADAPTHAADAPTRAARARRSVPRSQRSRNLVGLEIEPGQLIAVQSRLNGHVVVE